MGDLYTVFHNSVYQPVYIIDSPAPITVLVMFERFRFADAFVSVAVNVK